MSTDVIADALLGFATCESSIKSFSQILTTLHSIDALHRLKEKTDIVDVLLVIASFAPFFAPPPPVPPLTAVNNDGSSVEARLERLERRAETSRRNRLAVAGGRQDNTFTFTHTLVLAHSSMLEDVRDDDDDVPPPSQPVLSQLALPAHLIHPVRKSDSTPLAPKEKPLYSFLIHFPIFSALGARLSSVDREKLLSLSVMTKWGFENLITTRAYPRLRLTNKGTACVVVDEDSERLEEIRKGLEETEREIWDKNAADMLDRSFFLVGTWSEEHVALVFSLSHAIHYCQELGDFERWTTQDALWEDILRIYPVLSHYQEITSGQELEGSRPLLGARLFYRKQSSSTLSYYNDHHLTLMVPLLGRPHALLFASDFAAQHSTINLVAAAVGPGSDTTRRVTHSVGVFVVKMGPPPLKDDGNWVGPFLRNDEWLGGLDNTFHTKFYVH